MKLHPQRPAVLLAALFFVLPVPSLRAQSAADASGHWEGTLQIPGMELNVEVDLGKNSKGEWMGTISIPAQNMKGFPLSNVAGQAKSVSFLMKGIPGDPTFQGALSPDGKTISGDFSQGGVSLPFSLIRKGDAKIEAPAKSTPISKELAGT